jgi:short-subunit dehydrogenase
MNILISGGSSGLGLALCKKFIGEKRVKKIIVIGRRKIFKFNSKKVQYYSADLSEKNSIDNFFKKIYRINKIDVLINNAGSIFIKKELNSLKIEKTIFVNFIAPVYIFYKLKKKIFKSSYKTVINIISHANKPSNYSDILNFCSHRFNFLERYNRSKFYLTLFSFYLSQMFKNYSLRSICINPGRISTKFGKNNKIFKFPIYFYLKIFGKDPEMISENIKKIVFRRYSYKIYYDFNKDLKFNYNKRHKFIITFIIKKILNKLR